MTDDEKRGVAPQHPAAPRPGPPRPGLAPPRPSGDRHAAVAEVAALVEEEAELVEEISVSPPGLSSAASTAPTPAVAPVPLAVVAAVVPVLEEVAPVFGPLPGTHAAHAVQAPPSDAPVSGDPGSRHSRRFPFEINVDIVSEHNFYAGLSLNISEGGLFVATHVEYPVGTKLEIRLLLPGDEEPTTIKTEVRWVRPHNADADGSAGMGLRFIGLSPEVMTKIHRFAQNRDPLYYEDD
jgi:uncharacterized protein (TIGR02266 family)